MTIQGTKCLTDQKVVGITQNWCSVAEFVDMKQSVDALRGLPYKLIRMCVSIYNIPHVYLCAQYVNST